MNLNEYTAKKPAQIPHNDSDYQFRKKAYRPKSEMYLKVEVSKYFSWYF